MFDGITSDDLVLAFFPCIYFCEKSQLAMSWGYVNYRYLSYKERAEKILQRSRNREYFFGLLVKLFTIAKIRGLRLIVENPWSGAHFLKGGFLCTPSVIDNDRTLRGDCFKKPTAYWFVNCEPTYGVSYEVPAEIKRVAECNDSSKVGMCSIERSMITEAYARNWINDFIFGIEKEELG